MSVYDDIFSSVYDNFWRNECPDSSARLTILKYYPELFYYKKLLFKEDFTTSRVPVARDIVR